MANKVAKIYTSYDEFLKTHFPKHAAELESDETLEEIGFGAVMARESLEKVRKQFKQRKIRD